MRVRDISRSRSEVRTRRILCAALERKGYRVNPAVRVSDALEIDSQELREDDWHCFRTMHFDFVVTQGDDLTPQFVVEFDGPHHKSDSTAERLDAVKNKFCMDAGLPILRISSQELESHEHVSVLGWIVERWAAARLEYPAIVREMQERWELLAEDCPVAAETEEFYDRLFDCDPSVWFDLRHPYPARLTITHRLRRLGIAGPDMIPREAAEANRAGRRIWAQWMPVGGGDGPDPPFSLEWRATTRRIEVIPWEIPETWSERRTLFSSAHTVRTRCALPVGWNAPDFLRDLVDSDPSTEPLIAPFWYTELPGAPRSEIARGLAEYLALRDIEQWASQRCVVQDR